MNLFLVRHGLTPWNVAGRLQGWANTDLTPAGMAQADKTADFFADYSRRQQVRFYAIYSSPLLRAWLTAHAIGERIGLVPQPTPDLREMHGGAVEGLTRDEWQQRFPLLKTAWEDRGNLDFGWPGGETRRAFRARCLRAIGDIVAQHRSYDNLIVVTHGGVISAYLSGAGLDDPLGPRSYEAANCSITHVQYMTDDTSGSSAIWSVGCVRDFNSVSHLDEDASDLVPANNVDLALL